MATLFAGAGATAQALELLAHVEQRPAAWAQTRERAAHQATKLAAGMAAEQAEAARRRAGSDTLEKVVESLLTHT
jgi:hypothetical protein